MTPEIFFPRRRNAFVWAFAHGTNNKECFFYVFVKSMAPASRV